MSVSASPIPYTGSKSCIVKTILDVMPPHETYIEPCMGSAEVFFRKPPADREIINDYNGDLVNLFRVLQDIQNLDKVIGRLYLSLNAELLFRQNKELLTNTPNILDDLKETAEDMRAASWDEIKSAVAFFENQVYSFSSTGQAFGIMRRDLTHRFSRLLAACNRLRNATILHRDYKDAISYTICLIILAGVVIQYRTPSQYRGLLTSAMAGSCTSRSAHLRYSSTPVRSTI